MLDHVHNNNFLQATSVASDQYDYVPRSFLRSLKTQILDEGQNVGVIYLDLVKAFDAPDTPT